MTDTERIDWLEQQANEGRSPGIINDDNGHWAVSFTGFQEVATGDAPTDLCTSFMVEAADWKNSIREAIDSAMQQENP